MKIIHLPTFAIALVTASSAFAAIDCGTLPSCDDLGFNQTKAACPDKYQICPFDKNKVVCIDSPAIGDVKHSLKSANHDGWLLCDGKGYDRTTYSQLYGVIGTKFGGSGSNFNVPDYRGFFLRGAGQNYSLSKCKNGTADVACTGSLVATSNTSIYATPQKEQLPNITGSFALDSNATGSGEVKYAFGVNFNAHGTWSGEKTGNGCIVDFSANRSSSIYTDSGHVTPANYATYIFIYAGQ